MKLALAAAIGIVLGHVGTIATQCRAQTMCYVPRNAYSGGLGVSCWIPDLEDDGIDDFGIASVGEYVPGFSGATGLVHIYSGRTGQWLRSVHSPNIFFGYGYTFSYSIAGISDVDGDGAGDLIAGSHLEGSVPGQFGPGGVYLFSGRTGEVLHSFFPDPKRYPITGEFGWKVTAFPDLNGDGRGDVAIAEHGIVPGAVYVFSGATGEAIHVIEPTQEWGPPPNGGTFGSELSGVPDLDGDGVWDIVILYGARWGNGSSPHGRIVVYSGASGAFVYSIVPDESITALGSWQMQGVPDMNNDGRGDIVAHVLLDAIPGQPYSRRHRVHFYSGATGELFRVLASPANAAELGNSSFGEQFTWSPDADADGVADILISAPGETPVPGGWYNGQAYLYSGATGEEIRRYRSPNPPAQEGYFGARSMAMLGPHGRPQFLFSASREPTCHARLFRACLADWNQDGQVNSQDFFEYVSQFLGGASSADFNLDGTLNTQDFFDFIAALVAGC